MKKDRFERWLNDIYTTQEDEISCTECFDQVSHYVELEFSSQDAAAAMPQVQQHLQHCRACREEYEALHDLRQLDEEAKGASLEDLKDSIH